MEKEVTNKDLAKLIDNLALATARGFEGVNGRFEKF